MHRYRRKTKNSIFNSDCSQTGHNHYNRIQLHESHLPINRRMAFLPLPDMEILLPLTSGLAVGRNGAGLSPHIVGAFELLGQAQYPQERREVLRGNLLKGYLQLIAELVDQHFCIAALPYGLLKFFLHIIQRGLRVGGGLVFAVCFPDVPDDAVQIIVHDVAVKIAFLHLPQFQRPHIEVIFSGCILVHDGLPGGLQHQIHLLHPHIGDLVDADFHIYHQPPEIRVGSQFAEKPVVDFAAAQKFHHIITQMQRLKFYVWVIFIFRQPHQIVGGHAVKVSQRCNRKRADVLVVIGFVFSQRGFRQAGLLRQLFQRQVLIYHPQVFEPLRDCQLCVHPKPPLSLSFFSDYTHYSTIP